MREKKRNPMAEPGENYSVIRGVLFISTRKVACCLNKKSGFSPEQLLCSE
jgi:hypothetical protein